MMRRIMMLVAVAAMMVAMAAPAFAAKNCEPTADGESCIGGEGERGGTVGQAGRHSYSLGGDPTTYEWSDTGGSGSGAGGPGVQKGGGGGTNQSGTYTLDDTFDAQGQGGSGGGGHTREPDGGSGGQCSYEDSQLVEEHGNGPIC